MTSEDWREHSRQRSIRRDLMVRKLQGSFGFALAAGLALLLLPRPAHAQVVVKVNDNVNFRFGLQFQGWADWTQDANSEGYSENMFIRRIRFIMLATVAPG